MQLSSLRLVLALPVVLATLAYGTITASQADESKTPPQPGLPYLGLEPGRPQSEYAEFGWLGAMQSGLAGAVKAKQWTRIPLGVVAVNATFYSPASDDPNIDSTGGTNSRVFFVSPAGSKNNYGDSARIPVRTVAFGSLPTEVTLQVAQRRDADNLPIPFSLVTEEHKTRVPQQYTIEKTTLTDPNSSAAPRVEVRVLSVKVDGVDVGLTGGCTTGARSVLTLGSPLYQFDGDPYTNFDSAKGLWGIQGGSLFGTIDIAPFQGCATSSGDDIAPILTSAISGPGNPITARIGITACGFPPAPGQDTAEKAKCDIQVSPQNPTIRTIPEPVPYPTYAPGEAP